MDPRALHAFRVVAEAGSMTAAAGRLGTVQSALSARIRALEAEIGEPLFERLPRGIRLTAAGGRLLPYAHEMAALAAEALSAARGQRADPAGPFRLGAIEVAAATVLPRLVSRFVADHPAVDLQLRVGVSHDLDRMVVAGDLDAAVLAAPSRDPSVISRGIGALPLALMRPAGRAAGETGHAFAFGRGCVCRERLEALLHRRHLRLRLTDLGSVDAILGCVAAGLGVALLPAALAQGAGIATEAAGQLDLVLAARPEAAAIAGRLVALARAGHGPDQVRG